MSAEVLAEEYEVLSSIFPDELTKLGDHDLEIRVEPEEQPPAEEDQIVLVLRVNYPSEYPDVIPNLGLSTSEGELSSEEEKALLDGLKTSAEESLGMAMVFTLVSQLQEAVRDLVDTRVARRSQEAADTARREVEKEEARTKGTPVTQSSFLEWRKTFNQQRSRQLAQEDDEKMKSMSPKEREEYKKMRSKLSGRQIFERGNIADEDDAVDEGAVSVDISQYDRRAAREEDEDDEEGDRVHFSDSD